MAAFDMQEGEGQDNLWEINPLTLPQPQQRLLWSPFCFHSLFEDVWFDETETLL